MLEVDAQAEAAKLMEEHIERFGDAGGGHGIAFDNGFVSLGAAVDVVRLDGEDLLKDVGGAEGFERPYLHLTEALSAELGFTAEGLLGDERVRTDGASVHLVLDHVTELKHVDDAYGGGLVEAFAGAAVVEVGLAVAGQTGLVGPCVEVIEGSAVEDRGGELLAEFTAGPSEDGLEDLSEVHTRGHAQRVEDDVDRSTVGEEGHILLADDA